MPCSIALGGDNHLGRSKMIVVQPAMLLDAVHRALHVGGRAGWTAIARATAHIFQASRRLRPQRPQKYALGHGPTSAIGRPDG